LCGVETWTVLCGVETWTALCGVETCTVGKYIRNDGWKVLKCGAGKG